MNITERILAALRREPVDRVPVFAWLNPYDPSHWANQDRSYDTVMAAVREYGDANWACGLPSGSFFFSDYDVRSEEQSLPDGGRTVTLHTPKGPLEWFSKVMSEWSRLFC